MACLINIDAENFNKQKKHLRAQFLALRDQLAQQGAAHIMRNRALSQRLFNYLNTLNYVDCIGIYWPIRNEFDARTMISAWLDADLKRKAALPAVLEGTQPLAFYQWSPASIMEQGKFQIAIPSVKIPVLPQVLIIPCVGFTRSGYRLGYGSGFYDRTLALLRRLPAFSLAIGVAYEASCLSSFPLQSYDRKLDCIVTDQAVYFGEFTYLLS